MASRRDPASANSSEQPASVTSTVDLLDRFKQGDEQAVNQLVERSLPPLRRWARGRLPNWARSLADTQDLVQDAVIRALPRLKTFEVRHPGSLQAYLRQAITNHIRDEIRKVAARPAVTELHDVHKDPQASPLEQAIGREKFDRYAAALEQLRPSERAAIIARVEKQQSYEEIAVTLGKPNADAARMAVTRAMHRLFKVMPAVPAADQTRR